MVLEGPMTIIASICLTVLHPGLAFQGRWAESTWSLRGKKHESEEFKDEEMQPTNTPSLEGTR